MALLSIPDIDADPMLHGIVLDSQKDWSRSGVPIREDPSMHGMPMRSMALLQHSEEDYDAHIQASLPRDHGSHQVP